MSPNPHPRCPLSCASLPSVDMQVLRLNGVIPQCLFVERPVVQMNVGNGAGGEAREASGEGKNELFDQQLVIRSHFYGIFL